MTVVAGALVLYHIGEGNSFSEAIADASWAWLVGVVLILLVVRQFVRRLSPESQERVLRGVGCGDAFLAKAKRDCPRCGEKLTGIVVCPACGTVIEWSSIITAGAFILLAFSALAYAHFMSG
jgi:hypothetical protein